MFESLFNCRKKFGRKGCGLLVVSIPIFLDALVFKINSLTQLLSTTPMSIMHRTKGNTICWFVPSLKVVEDLLQKPILQANAFDI